MPAAPTITEEIQVARPDAPPVRATAVADPRKEYIAAGGLIWLPAVLRALPRYIDDVTRDFGQDLYTRMAWDPAVHSATRLLRASAVSAPVLTSPTVDNEAVTPQQAEWAQADAIALFCRRNLARVAPTLRAVLWDLSEAVTAGHVLAEQVYELAPLTPGAGPQLVLKALKVKDPATYAFVRDPYGNTPGVQYAAPGRPLVTTSIVAPDADGTLPNFLPRSKYVLYTHWPRYGDPRGQSILRAAYHAWWFKRQVIVDYLQYMAIFAAPMLWGTTAEGAQPADDGTSAEQIMLNALLAMRNAGAGVGPHSSSLTPIQAQGEGAAFLEAIDLSNHEITLAVLMATRATMEAQHGSRADSGTAQDVVELGVTALRGDLADVVRADILAPLIVLNYGAQALRYLPLVSLGTTERHDFAGEATAVAALAKTPVLHWSMLPGVRAGLNLPPADEKAEAEDRARGPALAERAAQAPPPGPQDNGPGDAPPPAKKGAPADGK